jgi:ectoine hydroxylase-related dioxygenase (phytanoyl-CoA dioxygenase family)
MTLSEAQRATYLEAGHVTVPGIFTPARMDQAVADAMAWAEESLAAMDEKDRAWYVDGGVKEAVMPRKMDQPVFFRPMFRGLASDPELTSAVESLIGPGLRVAFSQIFFKPPGGGGPKPVHQDNFYFGCDHRDGMVTAWVALDEATVENGCMHFADGSNKGPIIDHVAPEGEPFNLLIPDEVAAKYAMTPAPVPKGGVSFHHGNTLHQSSDNRSHKWRRAVAIHYVNAKTRFATPALRYDDDKIVTLS